jgi:chromosome segregation ATPase
MRFLVTLILMGLAFLGGFALAYFRLYVPERQGLNQFQTDAGDLQSQVDTLTNQLATREAELDEARTALNTSTTDLSSAEQDSALTRFENYILTARLALSESDEQRAALALRLAGEEMSSVRQAVSEAGTADSLQERLDAAVAALEDNNNRSALEALRRLSEDLQLLRDS